MAVSTWWPRSQLSRRAAESKALTPSVIARHLRQSQGTETLSTAPEMRDESAQEGADD